MTLKVQGQPPPSPTLPLLLWLALQIAPLLLAAFRIPLATGTAGYPEPAERLAAHLIVAVQIAGSALLFPFLLRTWSSSLMTLATAWPPLWLAGHLAALSPDHVLPVALFVTAWLAGLAAWRAAVDSWPRGKGQMVVAAVVTAVTLGGGVLWYFTAEFGPPPSPTTLPPLARFGPLAAALALLPGRTDSSSPAAELVPSPAVIAAIWAWPLSVLVTGLIAWAIGARKPWRGLDGPGNAVEA